MRPANRDYSLSDGAGNNRPAEGAFARNLASLVLVMHLFCVVLALTANLSPSPAQQTLLDKFSFYTRTLNFDLNFTPYHLTHGTIADVDHRIEILPLDKDGSRPQDWMVLPDVGLRGGERYKRYQRLASTLSFFANDESTAGQIAQSLGTNLSKQDKIVPRQIRIRKHLLQPINAINGGNPEERNAHSPIYFRVPYAANCVVNDDGTVNVIKLDEASQVAQPTSQGPRKP